MGGDWRDAVLDGIAWEEPDHPARNPLATPGYTPRPAVRRGHGALAGHEVTLAAWDFTVYGGSFGEAEADAFCAAVDDAVAARRPLVTLVRSGGTRLQEGAAALVGMARATLAVRRLAAAGIPHVTVADAPTTGGVWTTVVSRADLRLGVEGATVGFGGPRVVEAVTGEAPPAGSHTAESAFRAGLLDVLVAPEDVSGRLGAALAALAGAPRPLAEPSAVPPAPEVTGWAAVRAARDAARPDPADLLADWLPGAFRLQGPGGDASVAALVGTLAASGDAVVGVALAARRGGHPTPEGYRLLTRAARLAGRLGLPLLTLVDTPGAEPSARSESAGLAPAIGGAMDAVLACRSPTVAVLVGEGGSGGALAALVGDRVLVSPDGYLAALGPEGAAVTLRRSPAEAADLVRPEATVLRALGIADAMVAAPPSPATPVQVAAAVRAEAGRVTAERLAARERRWSAAVPGRVRPVRGD